MRVLLDECLPRRLKTLLTNHETMTVPGMGWAGLSNGQLLGRASELFDVFVTIDRGVASQQVVSRYRLAVVVLRARSNRLADLRPLVPALDEALGKAEPGQVSFVG